MITLEELMLAMNFESEGGDEEMAEHTPVHLVVDNSDAPRRHPREVELALVGLQGEMEERFTLTWQEKQGMWAFQSQVALGDCDLTYNDSRGLWREGWRKAWHLFLDNLEEIDNGDR